MDYRIIGTPAQRLRRAEALQGFQWVRDGGIRAFYHSIFVIATKETVSEGLQTPIY